MYRKLYLMGFAAYVFMLVLSILFYKERVIFLDSSFVLFQIVKNATFRIELNRFGEVFSEVWPVLCRKMGLSLQAISLSYSIGFILNYAICYTICGSILKQYRFALVLLMVNLLFAADTFYWPLSEVPQGMAILIVIWAIVWDKKVADIGPVRWLLTAAALVVVAFFHPLMLFALGYSIVFFLLSRKPVIDKRIFWCIGGFFLLILMVKAAFFRTKYEQHSLSGLRNFVRLFPNYFTIYSNKQFLTNCLTKYYWIPVVFLACAAIYLRAKEYLKLTFFAAAIIGYIMLVNIMYPGSVTPPFYIENLYLPLGLFLGLPLVMDLLPVLERRKIAIAMFALILLSGGVRIYVAHESFSRRLDWERNYIAKNGDRKIIADAKKADAGILQMLWGTPYEFWHLSTIEQGKSASIIIDEDPPHRDWAKNKTHALVVNWNVYDYSELDAKYFRFTDSTTGYVIENIPLTP